MPRVRCKKSTVAGGERLAAGKEYEVSARDASVLVAYKHAVLVTDEVEVDATDVDSGDALDAVREDDGDAE